MTSNTQDPPAGAVQEPRFTPATATAYQEGVQRCERDLRAADLRKALRQKAEEGWGTLCPLFMFGEADESAGNREEKGFRPLHPEIPDHLRLFISQVAEDFRAWVIGVAGLPESEGVDHSPDSDLWALDYQLGVLFLLRDAPALSQAGAFNLLLQSVQAQMEPFVQEFGDLLWQLDDVLHPKNAAERAAARDR